MNYTLALKLKNAGFPQKKLELSEVYVGVCKHGYFGFSKGREGCECGEEETVHIPTLSELIEACGDKFESLSVLHDKNEWIAYATHGQWRPDLKEYCESGCCGFKVGSTPEIAVANLWMSLNEK